MSPDSRSAAVRPPGPSAEVISERLRGVRDRISAAGGDPSRIVVVGVTKGFATGVAEAAVSAGLLNLGENYADELVAKASAIRSRKAPVRWHFLGALQTNKIGRLAPWVGLWQTVDTRHRIEALARRAPGAEVLVQVRLAVAAGRGGCEPAAVTDLVAHAHACGLVVSGLMGVGPEGAALAQGSGAPGGAAGASGPGGAAGASGPGGAAGASGPGGAAGASGAAFRLLASLADAEDLAVRSMGMSDDLEHAVRCGSTMVRVGTALFGPREPAAIAETRQ